VQYINKHISVLSIFRQQQFNKVASQADEKPEFNKISFHKHLLTTSALITSIALSHSKRLRTKPQT
jgi:hypothetical protein